MRKIFAVTAMLVLSTWSCTKKDSGQPRTSDARTSEKTLNLYCWSNYFSADAIRQFEQQTKTKVIFNYFSSNEELLAKLQAGARGYDLIVSTGYLVNALKSLDLIEKLGNLNWVELTGLSEQFKAASFDPKHEYTIPYAWGTTGIAVNRAKVKDKVDSLAWLFDHPELKGQITMLDDAPSVVGAALKHLGYSYNEESDEALAKAKALLARQKPLLRTYTPESQPVLASGEIAVAQAYSGDALQVKNRKNPNIEYVLPKEGGEMFIDALAIPKGAPSPELAKEFMRFTLRPAVALLQVQHLFFSPVVNIQRTPGAAPLLKMESVFPPASVLRKFELMNDNPKRIEAIQKLWTELKSM